MLLCILLAFTIAGSLTLPVDSSLSDSPDPQLILDFHHHPTSENLPFSITQEGSGVLSRWARESRKQFFSDISENRADEWIIVMGNEAGDTDSMAAAIAWAYHLSHKVNNSQKAIALLQTVEDALDLRPENHLALEKSQMSPRHKDLLTIDELPIKPFELSHHLAGIVLVDHNVPTPGWIRAPLLSIFDHHVDQKMNLSADPRILAKVGSCTSLVAKQILEADARGEHRIASGERYGIPVDLIDLMLRAIFLDTSALESHEDSEADKQVAFRLFKLSQWYAPPEEQNKKKWEKREFRKLATNFWVEMSEAREQLQQLDVRDLLRRDWKVNGVRTNSFNYPYLTLGFASIPLSIEDQIYRTPEETVPEWFAIERAFTSEIGADVSVVLTKFKSKSTGKSAREIMLVVAHGWGKRLTTEAATDLFSSLCRVIEGSFDGLEEWKRPDNKPLLPRRKGWRLSKNGQPMGRKLVMPLVLKAALDWSWNNTQSPGFL